MWAWPGYYFFYWRHKILDALQNLMNDVTLDGQFQTDDAFTNVSYNGNYKNFKLPVSLSSEGKMLQNGAYRKKKLAFFVESIWRVCLSLRFKILVNRSGQTLRRSWPVELAWVYVCDWQFQRLSKVKLRNECELHQNHSCQAQKQWVQYSTTQ